MKPRKNRKPSRTANAPVTRGAGSKRQPRKAAKRAASRGKPPGKSGRTATTKKSVRAASRPAVKKRTRTKAASKPPDSARQRKVNAGAKKSKIERAGIRSRQLGHVSSSVRRAQARRDSERG